MEKCTLCPRKCNVDRDTLTGFCGVDNKVRIARCALHMWEEGCISGREGSGAVFFSGCNLRCVYCQNYNISTKGKGRQISIQELANKFLELQQQGANNINLVTPTHYMPQIIKALDIAKNDGLNLPIVYNCGGYEDYESIEKLRGYVDIFLTDFKYFDNERGKRYSNVKDYCEVAKKALSKMFDVVGMPVFDERGIMLKGIIVRHLMLPGGIKDSKNVIKYLYQTYADNIFISIMSQYTPLEHVKKYKELDRKLYPAEYKRLVNYAIDLGVINGFTQDMDTADESFIPEFCEK